MAPVDKVAVAKGGVSTALTATRLPPTGFWSYARQDDQLSSGKLTSLRSLLIQELQQQYGREEIRLFQDAKAIALGSDWEKQIQKALNASTFFIPIITPNFLQSEWCCREVELFLQREQALHKLYPNLSETSLIFPMLFIGVDDVEPEDPAVLAALQKLQWFDFRHFRHRNYDDAEVREAISSLAGTMRVLLKAKILASVAPPKKDTVEAARGDTVVVGRNEPTGDRVVEPKPAGPARADSSARPIAVGDVLNHMFEVKRFIKAGGMGQVFEGFNVMTGERVAIKALLPALAADPKVIALFQREAMTLTRLNHEALVQYRVLAKEPELGGLYIVTEYVDGVDLGETLGTVDRSGEELTRLLARLASGLAAAHRLGAIHRDISPDNVMLPGGDIHQAKIIDFGIAKDLGGALPTLIGDGFAGKLNFVAPEQLGDHDGAIGPWTDVYSLGLVILSVARGEKVDMSGSFADAIRKRRDDVEVSAAPESLRPLLTDMLRSNPAKRIRTMDEVAARLAAAPPAPPAPAEDLAEAYETQEPDETSRRALWPMLAVVALAAIILLIWQPWGAPGIKATAPEPTAGAAQATAPRDRSWLFRRWCVIDRASGRQAVWRIREEGGRIVASYPGGSQTETIRRTRRRSVVTDKATYMLDPAGDAVTVREGASITLLEQCR